MNKDKITKKENKLLEKDSQEDINTIENPTEEVRQEIVLIEEPKEDSFKLPKITVRVPEENK